MEHWLVFATVVTLVLVAIMIAMYFGSGLAQGC